MQPSDDSALLREYAENNSEEAFAALVARHVNLVYSVALRHVNNPHHAEEVTQAVFIIFAKKAAQLRHDRALSSWLFQATRLTANNFVRSENRRHRREQEAHMQSVLNEPGLEVWPGIAPLLDAAIAGLREKDRRAIVLRFYEGRNLREVGEALGAGEDAAEKRVNRALEKLRKFFAKRGVISTTAVLAGVMSANSVQAAPVALAKSVTVVAVAKGAAATGSMLILTKGALGAMAWTKAKMTAAIAVGVLVAAGATIWVVDDYIQNLHFSDAYLRELQKAPPVLVIQKTHFQNKTDDIGSAVVGDKMIGRNQPLDAVIRAAYMEKPWQNLRAIFPTNLPMDRYDYLITVPDHPREKFQELIRKQLGYTAHLEKIETNWFALKVVSPGGAKFGSGLKPAKGEGRDDASGLRHLANQPMEHFCEVIEIYFFLKTPVVDETGLPGVYDITLDWQWKGKSVQVGDPSIEENFNRFSEAIHDQLGLKIVPGNGPIEMLVVEKVKQSK